MDHIKCALYSFIIILFLYCEESIQISSFSTFPSQPQWFWGDEWGGLKFVFIWGHRSCMCGSGWDQERRMILFWIFSLFCDVNLTFFNLILQLMKHFLLTSFLEDHTSGIRKFSHICPQSKPFWWPWGIKSKPFDPFAKSFWTWPSPISML